MSLATRANGPIDPRGSGRSAPELLDTEDRTVAELVEIVQLTEQPVSQLVESLVNLGYVDRPLRSAVGAQSARTRR